MHAAAVVVGGRPPSLDAKQLKAALAMMRNRDMSVDEISRQFGVSRTTLYSIQSAGRAATEQFFPESGVAMLKG
ncbi:DNA invertase [Pandoraea captiosa]|uniref:DNA invertase n=1 Tax=Pandoraea captiosa TaxID=2508302 RepID=A0A5E5AXZ4_9BURK|nr:DNA invertase [Pandoraea captiosa]